MCQRLFQQQLAGGVSSLLPEPPVWRKLEPGPAASMIMLGAFMRTGSVSCDGVLFLAFGGRSNAEVLYYEGESLHPFLIRRYLNGML
ncbi:hypothetical protein CRI71_12655 [Klebsiella sp. KG9]|nr:hypothetical protein CRI71_12655 [Klebsiella sp. KG9]